MKTVETKQGILRASKKYFIIQGNNGNHKGHNREWKIFGDGYNTKREAQREYNKAVNDNGDIKHGLTPLRIVTAMEIAEIIDSEERIFINTCFDVSLT